MAADAARHQDTELMRRFRMRALVSGLLAGALAIAGLAILHSDARPLAERLLAGPAIAALVVSIIAGIAALLLVAHHRFEPARYTAALAVAATIAGWALAQQPELLPSLTIRQAAASHDTLWR